MKKIFLLMIIFIIILILMYSNNIELFKITKDSINIIIESIVPSLLPYMIIISLINELGGFEIIGFLIQFIFKPIFNIDTKSCALIVAGGISGYPLPSVILSNQEKITEEQQQIISIFVFPSLAFLLNQIGINLTNNYNTTRLIGTFFIGAFILLFIERYKNKKKVEYLKFSTLKKLIKNRYNNICFSLIWKKSLLNSFINLGIISSNIIIFTLISYIIDKYIYFNISIQGLFDFSSASIMLSNNINYYSYIKLITILLWGGISIFMQNSAILGHTNFSIKKYIIYRIRLIIIVILIDYLIFF